MFEIDTYLNSTDFTNLCLALDFLPEDIDEIKQKAEKLTDNIEDSLALIIYDHILKYRETPSREFCHKFYLYRMLPSNSSFSNNDLFYQFYIRDNDRWVDVENKLKAGIESGKLNSEYFFEKEYNQELDMLSKSKVDDAYKAIYLHEINYLVNNYDDEIKKTIITAALNNFLSNPLLFNDVKRAFYKFIRGDIEVDVKYIVRESQFCPYSIIKNKTMAGYIDSLIARYDDKYEADSSEYMLTYYSDINGGDAFYVMTCGDGENFKHRNNLSNIFIVKKELLDDSEALLLNENSHLINDFEGYVDGRIDMYHISLDELNLIENDDFKLTEAFHNDDKTTWHIIDALEDNDEYNPDDLSDVVSKKPLSCEFLGLISSLNLTIDDAYEIQGDVKSGIDAMDAIIKKISGNDILKSQVDALIDFREMDKSYFEKLYDYIADKGILNNGICEYLNDMVVPKVIEKPFLDEGKFAAPRWLVYPELDPYTIGWRMGYGEDYAMNEPWHTKEFNELFPQPQNWKFDSRKSDFGKLPLLCYLWRDYGKAKYSKIGEDAIEVNDFITFEQRDLEFRNNHFRYKSIEHAVLASKYQMFEKADPMHTSINTLKRGFDLTEEQIEYWQSVKYTVLLNACYYKFMQDDALKKRLLDTGKKDLVYSSDDEWGGEDNLLGFALMELRDEMRRLYEHEDLIDWEYTEYLKHLNPYENPQKRNPNDMQSGEYMVIASTLNQSSFYVRDCNLSDELADKYEVGQILTEKAFVDATDKIGGISTTHRYLILSNGMADLSQFEKGTDWGIHTANVNSKFKVLDIYRKHGKTQIFLLQLPEGFEEVFTLSNNLINQRIEYSRKLFDSCLSKAIIEEVNSHDWLERVSFPLGMDENGNFF